MSTVINILFILIVISIITFINNRGKNKSRNIVSYKLNSPSLINETTKALDVLFNNDNSSFMIISYGEYYIQYMSFKQNNSIYCELSNRKFNGEQIDLIIDEYKFSRPNIENEMLTDTDNYAKIYNLKKYRFDSIVEEGLAIFKELYSLNEDSLVELEISIE